MKTSHRKEHPSEIQRQSEGGNSRRKMFRQRDSIKKILEWRENKATTTTKSEIKRIKQMGVAGKEF